MKHARTQIRDMVAAVLMSHTSAGDHVYEARVYALDDMKLPALLVYTKQDTVVSRSISLPRTQQRELVVTVEAYVKSRGNIDDVTDALALEVEQRIAADPTLGGLVKDITLTSTDMQFSDDGERPVAVAVLTFTTLYTVKEHQPQTLI
jgi:hypothetical protein